MSTTFTSGTTIRSADVNANFLEKKARTYSTTATAAGTTTLTVSSNQLQFFTGTTAQTVTLPVATTMSLGYGFEIFNLSTGVVTVNTSGANLVQSMASGSRLEVICILTSGTTAASWQVIYTPAFATGLLPIVNGGTNNASLSVVGGVIYYGDGTKVTALANGTAGQSLVSGGTTVAPSWSSENLKLTASYYVSANFAATSTVPINYDTVRWDANSAVTTSATAWKFTVPTGYAGKYQVTILTIGSAVGTWFVLRKNGTNTQRIHYAANWSVKAESGSTFIQLADGDYIDIVPTDNITMTGGALSTGPCTIAINRTGS